MTSLSLGGDMLPHKNSNYCKSHVTYRVFLHNWYQFGNTPIPSSYHMLCFFSFFLNSQMYSSRPRVYQTSSPHLSQPSGCRIQRRDLPLWKVIHRKQRSEIKLKKDRFHMNGSQIKPAKRRLLSRTSYSSQDSSYF